MPCLPVAVPASATGFAVTETDICRDEEPLVVGHFGRGISRSRGMGLSYAPTYAQYSVAFLVLREIFASTICRMPPLRKLFHFQLAVSIRQMRLEGRCRLPSAAGHFDFDFLQWLQRGGRP